MNENVKLLPLMLAMLIPLCKISEILKKSPLKTFKLGYQLNLTLNRWSHHFDCL